MNDTREKPEDAPSNGDPAGPPEPLSEVEALQRKLEAAESKASEHWDQLLRATAELDNVRKRAQREGAALQKYALERILGDLIVVHDSLELGARITTEKPDADAIREGLALTQKQFWATLERYGLSEIDPAGQPFDPEQHEAVSMVKTDDVAPQHVVSVMQKGYKLHDRILRPAMVVVAQAPGAGNGADSASDTPDKPLN